MTVLSEVQPGEAAQKLHRDAGVYPLPADFPEVMVNTIWALDAFTPANGATVIVAGSHRDPSARDQEPVVMSPGSVLVYSGRLLHKAGRRGTRRLDRSADREDTVRRVRAHVGKFPSPQDGDRGHLREVFRKLVPARIHRAYEQAGFARTLEEAGSALAALSGTGLGSAPVGWAANVLLVYGMLEESFPDRPAATLAMSGRFLFKHYCYTSVMAISFIVQVPPADEEDLRQLLDGLKTETSVVHSRPFDGETVVQALVALPAALYPYFHTWIAKRTERSKSTYVSIDGMRFKGYTATDVVFIAKELERRLQDDTTELD